MQVRGTLCTAAGTHCREGFSARHSSYVGLLPLSALLAELKRQRATAHWQHQAGLIWLLLLMSIVLRTAFGWTSCEKGNWYKTVQSKVQMLKVSGQRTAHTACCHKAREARSNHATMQPQHRAGCRPHTYLAATPFPVGVSSRLHAGAPPSSMWHGQRQRQQHLRRLGSAA